ncbi:MAG: hypothetical protein Pg6B_06380 [Candidatus Azobacteroides pseudotrichonymphae]|jgi:hypothetical protein|nr:MAG: hypothetical protein Pg6B_06380 [Candidatus Azobacteroides pseudotrichonymphae]
MGWIEKLYIEAIVDNQCFLIEILKWKQTIYVINSFCSIGIEPMI